VEQPKTDVDGDGHVWMPHIYVGATFTAAPCHAFLLFLQNLLMQLP